MVHIDRSCFIEINAFHLLVLIIKFYVHSAFCFLAANYKHQSVAFVTSLHHIFKMSATFFLFFFKLLVSFHSVQWPHAVSHIIYSSCQWISICFRHQYICTVYQYSVFSLSSFTVFRGSKVGGGGGGGRIWINGVLCNSTYLTKLLKVAAERTL